ncbi:MAG: glycoside hydrolase family 2 TIM barrel-domain containing protein, partial [Novosphingobium sp.]
MSGGPRADRRDALALAAAGAALLPLGWEASAQAAPRPRGERSDGRGIPFDLDWRFHRGPGEGFEAPGAADAGWRRVDLPHDWSVEDIPGGQGPDRVGPFDKNAEGKTATGFTVGGEGWYRKRFRADRIPAGARVEVLFEGAYLDTEVWLNGQRLGENVHGYTPFAFDLTPHLRRAGDNVLAVRVRNLGRNSRWYGGSGLYRQVTLDILPAGARLARWGVAAWTRRIADGAAEIEIATTVLDPGEGFELVTRLRDESGRVIAQGASPAVSEVRQTLAVRGPRLWSPDSPALYALETELRRGGEPVDRIEQPFGIRIVAFDPQRGMTINGARTELRGGCIHHDNGLLGACAFADADERRVRLLKARGFNAVRSSHNPSSRSFRHACDKLGMLLIEEAFDTWNRPKLPQDFSTRFPQHWQEVLAAMVLPARNSPSVIMWSIGNEVPMRSSDDGVEWEWKLANAIKRLDRTRPVAAGLNGTLGQVMIAGPGTAKPGFAGNTDNASVIFLDIPGYNYRLNDIEREHAQHPQRVVFGSETFPSEVFEYRALMDRAPYFLGEFPWTAMDYIGEAAIAIAVPVSADVRQPPGGWPWVNAWCGDIDLIGHQKPQSLARDVAWGLSPVEVMVQRPIPDGKVQFVSNWGWPDELPMWTWPGSDGKPMTVRVYARAERVELVLNGVKVAERALGPGDKVPIEFEVPYAAG